MPRLLLAVCISLIATVAFFAGRATNPVVSEGARAAAAPAQSGFVHFDPPHVELGELPWNSVLESEAVLRNDSAIEVAVETARTGCACVNFKPSDYAGRRLPPGQTLRIPLSIHMGTRAQRREADLEVLMSNGVVHHFAASFEVVATYEIWPERIEFGDVDLDLDETLGESSVVSFRSPTAQILQVSTDVPWLSAARADVDEQVQIAVQVNRAALPHGRNVASVAVLTDDPYRPAYYIQVVANGQAAVRAVPGVVVMRQREWSGVRFLGPDGNSVTIAEVENGPSHLLIEKAPVRGSLSLQVRDSSAATPAGTDTIHVRLANGRSARFFVAYSE